MPEYGIEPRGKGLVHRYVRRALVVAAAAAIVMVCWVGSSLVPCSRASREESCVVCGAERHVWTSYIMGFQSGHEESEGQSEFVDIYDRLVGEPHTHAWLVTAHSTAHGNLWGYGGIGEGGSTPPQIEVTEVAIRWMKRFADRGLQERRQIYGRLRSCRSQEEVDQTAEQIFQAIHGHPQ
jgi:hypothetical protein